MEYGVIERFDDHRGGGWLRTDAGETFYFHCVTIADGSRSIEVGTRAEGIRHVGHLGRDEVVEVRTLE